MAAEGNATTRHKSKSRTQQQLESATRKPSRLAYFRRDRFALVALTLVIFLVLVAIFGSWIAPHGYDDQQLRNRVLAPFWGEGGSASYLLGTDQLGRDILSRIVIGTRVSLGLATAAIAAAAAIGILLGLVAGYYGKKVDAVIMRLADVQLSLPYLLFAIAVIAILGPSITNLLIIMILYSWAAYARLIRVATLSLRERDFVLASRSIGASDLRLVAHHITPNVIAPAVIITSYKFAELIILEASLSFLGLGVQPPLPSWGGMLGEGREYFTTAWWLATFPGFAIMIAVLGANMLGDALRDFLDPRLRNV